MLGLHKHPAHIQVPVLGALAGPGLVVGDGVDRVNQARRKSVNTGGTHFWGTQEEADLIWKDGSQNTSHISEAECNY